MAVFDANTAVDFTTLDLTVFAGTRTFVSSTEINYTAAGVTDTLTGTDFEDVPPGNPNAGTINTWTRTGGAQEFTVTGLSISTGVFLAATTDADTLLSLVFAGDDTLNGSTVADHLIGYAGNDAMIGGGDDDTLEGDVGNDTLTGGAGADSLAGGKNDDLYIIDSSDTVTEASSAGTDTVQIGSTYALEANFEHLTLTGTGDIDGTGNNLNNTITGTSGENALDGSTGNDSLVGNDGDDTLLGDAGDDTLDGGDGADSLDGGADNDDLLGGIGNDTLLGQAGTDSLVGGANDDSLDGGAGNDTMEGGAGNDTYVVDVTSDVVTEAAGQGTDSVQSSANIAALAANVENLTLLGTATLGGGNAEDNKITGNTKDNSLSGAAAEDTLDGGDGSDTLSGGTENDSLIGGADDDTLDGGAGSDTMAGGAGNDTYVVDNAGDKVTENAGEGTADLVQASVDHTLAAEVENLELTGTGDINGTGNGSANTITGNDGKNTMSGLAGADTLDGGKGDDSLIGGTENDSLVGDIGNDTMEGDAGVDTMAGGAGNDVYVIDSSDSISEAAGAGTGTDEVQIGSSYTLLTNFENLTLTGSADIDGTGNGVANTIHGNSGKNELSGLAGADTLDGGAGNDTLSGGTENDSLIGGANDDSLDGGTGNDTMKGGAGNDIYVVDSAGDSVTENPGEGTADLVQSSVDYTLGADLENLTLTGTADIDGSGNGVANIITGNDGKNTLSGLAGNDTLDGGIGNDTLQGGDDVDSLIGGANDDSLDGGAGNDTMKGGTGNDTYVVDSTSDSITEAAGEGTDLVQASTNYTLGAELENLTLTGTDDIDGTGNGVANKITGNAGANILSGLAGNDTLDGGAENDTLLGGADSDSLTGGANDDSLDGGVGVDTMAGGDGNDIYVVDSASDDVNESGTGTDEVQSSVSYDLGTAGTVENLTLTGSADIDGTGNGVANVITGNLGKNTLSGLAGADTLDGGAGTDTLLGGTEADSLLGGANDDSLDGGGGNDTMKGGAGNDTYVVDVAGDSITENAGEGTADLVQSGVTYTLGAELENLTLTGAADINGTGNGAANVITGNTGANVLSGLAGVDTLDGGDDNDTLLGGTEADSLLGGAKDDSLDGGAGNDTMKGGTGNDTYVVDSTSDSITEAAGEGTDLVQSNATYTLGAELENLTLTGTGDIDGTGNGVANVITGNDGKNTLSGLAGNDTLDGGDGDDTLLGGADSDSLIGGFGNDSLDGGAGVDTMAGGDGNDIYVVDTTSDDINESGTGTDEVQSSVSYDLGTAGAVENLTLTGAGNINGTGNGVANVITGNTGANILSGLAGADTLDGGSGNDTLQGGTEGDSLLGGANDDSLDGGAGNDTMKGGAGNDTYVVDAAGDSITENATEGADLVQAGVTYTLGAELENLTLIGAADINGTGNGVANIITGNAGANVLSGLAGADTLDGGADNDTLLGGTEADSLLGGANDDSLDGGAGSDTMKGGVGNDTYVVDVSGDSITEVAGEGTDLVQAGADYTLGAEIENLTLTGIGNINGTGNGVANVITGNDGNNKLLGDAGNDTINGGIGNDTLQGDAGIDSLSGGADDDLYVIDDQDIVVEGVNAGTDTVQIGATYTLLANFENLTLTGTGDFNGTGNTVANAITGNTGANILSGLAGADTLDGGSGNDTLLGGTEGDSLLGGANDDSLDGGAGIDTMKGGLGNDTYVVDVGGDSITENAGEGTDLVQAGSDYTLGAELENLTLTGTGDFNGTGNTVANVITGNTGANILSGLAGADTLDGGLDNDTLLGGTEADSLLGGANDDSLDGGTGNDTMKGGAGNDTYVVDSTTDAITENAAEGTADLVQSTVDFTLGAELENLTLMGAADIDGTGNGVANKITGNTGHNILSGVAGNDILDGGDGNDTLIGGTENDSLVGGIGDDSLSGGVGVDTMAGGDGNDIYVVDTLTDDVNEVGTGTDEVQASITYSIAAAGTVENLTLTGSTDIDGTGNTLGNVITGNSGKNSLSGGDGTDSLVGNAGVDTLHGGNDNDTLLGGNDADQLFGDAGNDSVDGGTGADTLDGGAGALDTLAGGADDDLYIVDSTTDTITEGVSAGNDTVQSGVTFSLAAIANVEHLTLTGAGNISGTGNDLTNKITGNTGDNILDGGLGADTLAGDTGDDTYIVDNLSDVVTEALGAGTDEIQTKVNLPSLATNVENLTLLDGATIGVGNGLNNIITGNAVANTLDGGVGVDSLIGGDGNDTYIVDDTNDKITEIAGKGIDLVKSSVSYTLGAEVDNLTLTGTAATGTGNGLVNLIIGNGSDNTLDGAGGADSLQGGAGNDTYIVDNTGDDASEAGGSGIDIVLSSVNFTLGTDIENLTLSGTAATGTGNTLGNIINGNASNNTLDGAAGADSLFGGKGDDLYIVDNLGDQVSEAGGSGVDKVQSSVTFTLGTDLENLVLTGGSAINGTGNGVANLITGNTGANILTGLLGNDTLDGGDENDTLLGGDDVDSLIGGAGNDSLDGGAGVDAMAGGNGSDIYVVDTLTDDVNEVGDGTDEVQASISYSLATAGSVENLTLTGTAATGTGNTLANIITGNGSDNTLDGAAGPDSLLGGDGNDTYIVDEIGDKVTEAAGKGIDIVKSSANFTLGADIENLTLTGTAALGTGNTLGNIITGNASNNTLDGAAGADSLSGGAGNDTYIVDNLGDDVSEAGGSGIDLVQSGVNFTLGADLENLTLTGTAATGTGNTLGNIINGNAGDNTLDGAGGADSLAGDDGDDTYIVDDIGDKITELAGKGLDTVKSSVSFILGAEVENLTLLAGATTGTGNTLANVITGNTADNTLDGAAGGDSLLGGDGNDTYIVDDLGDKITEAVGKGIDIVLSGVNFTLGADIENLTLTGTAATGTGNALGNVITGNASNNTLDGAAGIDTLSGGAGNDTYIVDNLGDQVSETGGSGTDLVQSGVNFTLGAGLENLTLTGAALTGTGNTLGNIITGNANANTLDGAAGADSLSGGAGNDTYVVDSGADTVSEAAGEGDDDLVQSSVDYVLGAEVENLTLIAAAITGTGNALANKITANGEANKLFGGAENDTIDGGAGKDTLQGDAGADSLLGGADDDFYNIDDLDAVVEGANAGTDTVQIAASYVLGNNLENLTLAGTGDFTGTGNALKNAITGNTGSNVLFGGAEDDSLSGGDGADTLQGDAGTDTLAGGGGNDIFIVDSGDSIQEGAAAGTDEAQSAVTFSLAPFANVENLTLMGSGNVNGTGNDGVNKITGNIGANILDGGLGADTLIGGEGNDTYIVDSVSDVLTEGGAGDIDEVQTTVSLALGANLENLTLLGTAATGTGNELANIITGNSAGNTLDGGIGIDTLVGGVGNDTYIVDDGADKITEAAGEGTDLVKTSVTYSIAGLGNVENLTLTDAGNINGTGNDVANVITGNIGKNSLFGGAGADNLAGGDGSDTLEGGIGIDTLIGGLGDDRYIVEVTADVITELSGAGSGIDTVEASADYTLSVNIENLILTSTAVTGKGNADANSITGNALANSLFGEGGNDTLTGNGGNDTLSGGLGTNVLIGGLGDDTYEIDVANDTVTEKAGEGIDTLLLNVSFSLQSDKTTEIENLQLTGTANIDGTGNVLKNTIKGNSGNNKLNGAGGDDTLIGGKGDDTYVIDDIKDTGKDVVIELAGEGIDTIASAATIVLAGFSEIENLTLTGNNHVNATGSDTNNKITGNDGNNSLAGGNGDDTLIGSGDAVADTLNGGAGNDQYFVEGKLDTVIDSGGVDTVFTTKSLTLANGIENVVFIGTGDMEVIGNSGNNKLEGGAGNDTINGLAGADTMIGFEGDDLYFVDNVGDKIEELPGQGTDTVNSTISYILAADLEHLKLLGAGNINGTGNAANNEITGNSGANRLDGGAGADKLDGGKGNDTYVVDNINDEILDESGIDSVEASGDFELDEGLENLTLTGTGDTNGAGNTSNNRITGNSGDNLLEGGVGKDTLIGGAGDDKLDGGILADVMMGGDGSDTYVLDKIGGFDAITEGKGQVGDRDKVQVTDSASGYVLGANLEDMEFIGSGSAVLVGNALNNILTGHGGRSNLNGGAGADTMIGGEDDDIYQVDNVGDVLIEGPLLADGDDTIFSVFSTVLGNDTILNQDLSNFEHVILKQGVAGAKNATGNDRQNFLTGNEFNNVLSGEADDDSLVGALGADTLIGGLGNDTLHFDNLKDVLVEENGETGGKDTVLSSLSVDLELIQFFKNIENIDLLGAGNLKGLGNALVNDIVGNNGANLLDGRAGNDFIFGGIGNDTIEGGLGEDAMFGSIGNDLFFVDNIKDVVQESIKGNEGIDTVQSKVDFTLEQFVEHLTLMENSLGGAGVTGTGNASNNIIIGNFKDNKLFGLDGNDILTGNGGNDTIDGGKSIDTMTGGLGDDVYIVDEVLDKVTEGLNAGKDRVESSATFVLSANVEDLTLTGDDDVNGTGNNLDNTIIGNDGNNTLNGLGSINGDTMIGGLGDDIYIINSLKDLADETTGGGGADTLVTFISIDLEGFDWIEFEHVTLTGKAALFATGDNGDNKLTGNSAGNRLEGRMGNDTLDGLAGVDTMIGGAGNDTYTVDNIKDVIDEVSDGGSGTDTVSSFVTYVLTEGFENLTLLGKANINATGSALNNVMKGNDGNNLIDGLDGADTMSGGKGNDTFIVNDVGDKVSEGAQEGTADTVRSLVDFTLGAELEHLTLLGDATKGTGNGNGNIIIGNFKDNTLLGLAGNDNLTGADGNDTLDGGAGGDVMAGGAGSDVYIIDDAKDKVSEVAGPGIDLVKSSVTHFLGANFENLTLTEDGSTSTAENATGNSLDNFIEGNSEANLIDGLAGADTMAGGGGNDIYRINTSLDVIIEGAGAGIDTVQSGITIASLWSGVDNIFMVGSTSINATGNELANRIQGSNGSNKLFGLAGDDTIIGSGGTDTLSGGTGRDTFSRLGSLGEGIDIITDFDISATGDFLDVSDILIGFDSDKGSQLSAFVRTMSDGINTTIQIDRNGSAGGIGFVTLFVLQGVDTDITGILPHIIAEDP